MTDSRLQLPKVAQLAVLGSPILHSKSPQIHAAAYRELGLDWEYGRSELQADELSGYLAALGDDWRGLSLTMPLKAEAHRLATVLDPVAQESGVANTLLKVAGKRATAAWAGFNTDVGGLASAIRREGLDPTHTTVFGAGATAVSAVLAARMLGATHVTVLARRIDAARALALRFDGTSELDSPGMRVTAGALYADDDHEDPPSLIISTLPGGKIDWDRVVRVAKAPTFDVAYDSWPSELADLTEEAGHSAYSGVAMLVEQAILQIRIFVNGDPATVLNRETEVRESMYRAAGL